MVHPVSIAATIDNKAVASNNPAAVSTDGPRHRGYVVCKLVIEWLFSLVLLVLTSPLMLVMALLAKISSPGPAFYRQTRAGLDGRPFSMLKIRTMITNSETATGAVWSSAADARVTRVGRFLRDTHLDELPQLINVLRGQMGIIGPRPERPELIEKITVAIPQYTKRLGLRPGLTGLAQVQRPADASLEDVRQKLAYDLYYIRNVTLWLDLRIVLCTFFHLSGLLLNSLGKLLVRSYGEEAERSAASVQMVAGHGQRVSVV